MFGIDPTLPMPNGMSAIQSNRLGGKTVFIRKPNPNLLADAFNRLGVAPDVALDGNPAPRSGNGVFGYIHRRKEGKDLYFFGNSSDTAIDTMVELRGHLSKPQIWNPHNGDIAPVTEVSYGRRHDGETTRLRLKVDALSSRFLVGTMIQ